MSLERTQEWVSMKLRKVQARGRFVGFLVDTLKSFKQGSDIDRIVERNHCRNH